MFILIWLVGWTVCVIPFDVFLGWLLFAQLRALDYPTTEGVVTSSGLSRESGADGTTYRLALTYEYEVDGRKYTGSRYEALDMGTGKSGWRRVLAELPVGARVPVYYAPDDPAVSLLRPGLTGHLVGLIWFLTPFNAVMVGGWIVSARARRPAFDPDDSRTVEPTHTGWLVHLPAFSRVGVFLATMLAASVCGIFAWGFVYGFNPPVWVAGGSYVAAVALSVKLASGTWPALEVDEEARVVRLAVGTGAETEVPFATITGVTVTEEVKHFADSADEYKYHCDLVRADGEPVRAATYAVGAPAEAFAAWLRGRLRLPSGEAPPV